MKSPIAQENTKTKTLGDRAKSFGIKSLIVVNIAVVGAIGGAYTMHSYDNGTASQTAKAVQAAVTASALAASPKANSR